MRFVKILRITGLIAVVSYMIIILFVWIYANINGNIYFSAGEPISLVKYFEWLLGFIGIIVSIDFLRKELNYNN